MRQPFASYLVCIALFVTGCASVPPGAVKTWGSAKRFAPAVDATLGHGQQATFENRLTPILYINNLEGSAWAGKSDWIPSDRLIEVAAVADRVVRERLGARLADIPESPSDAEDTAAPTDRPRYALVLSPNALPVPDFTMKDFAKLVAGQTAQVAAGVPAPVAIGTAAGTRREPAAGERYGYFLWTHPAYGTSVQVVLRWELINLTTGATLHKAELGTVLRMPRDVKKKRWAELEEADRAMIWDGLLAGVDDAVNDQLTKLGF